MVTYVRLIESLDEYRLNGLSNCRYLQCKNFAYRTFWPDYLRMITRKKESGYEYIHPIKLLLNAMIYPYSWLSPIVYIMDVIKRNLRFSSYNK